MNVPIIGGNRVVGLLAAWRLLGFLSHGPPEPPGNHRHRPAEVRLAGAG